MRFSIPITPLKLKLYKRRKKKLFLV